VKHRDLVASALCASATNSRDNMEAADRVLAAFEAAGLVLMPAEPSVRLRHEATKGVTGITAAAFGTMWRNLVTFARQQDR
jgi:hypothetical protein